MQNGELADLLWKVVEKWWIEGLRENDWCHGVSWGGLAGERGRVLGS